MPDSRSDRSGARTWLVLVRDLPKTIRIKGERRLNAALVLDMDTGLVLAGAVGRSEEEALAQAFESAAIKPAAPLRPRPPDRVFVTSEKAPRVVHQLRQASERLPIGDPEVVEVSHVYEGEDIFDSFVGHLSGRAQPSEPPSPEDWRLLFDEAWHYCEAAPWDRWTDSTDLALDLRIGRQTTAHVAIVLGHEGLQHGLVVYPGTAPPAGLSSWKKGMDVPLPAGTLMFYLDPRKEPPPEFPAKAGRYGWPAEAPLVPVFVMIGDGGPGDIGRLEARQLTLAIAAVVEHDRRGLVAAGTATPVKGARDLADRVRGTFAILQRPPAEDAVEPGRLRLHQLGFDLVPEDVPVMMGSIPRDALPLLRKQARIHRPLPASKTLSADAIPLIVIPAGRRAGDELAGRIADQGPFGVALVENEGQVLVTLVCAAGVHALMELPADAAGLALFQMRMRAAGGFHVVMVADEASSRGEGRVYGLFECQTPDASPVRVGGPRPGAGTPRAPQRRRRRRR